MNEKEGDTFEENNVENESVGDVQLVKEENEKGFWDITLACDDEQMHDHKVIPTFVYYCVKCPAIFSFEDKLNKHMWFHNETLDNSCNICNKLFSLRSEQKKHMKKETNKFSLEYHGLNFLNNWRLEGSSFLQKHGQNFVFQVF